MFRLPKLFRARPQSPRTVRLGLEGLEGRALPSGFAGPSLAIPVTADVKADFNDVKVNASQLTAALASNRRADIVEDVKEMNADIANVSADLNAGKDAVKDVGAVITQVKNLRKDLGAGASIDAQADIHDLLAALRDLSKDDARLQRQVNADLREDRGELIADVQAVANAIASDKAADVVEDVKELQSDLAAVKADMAAGRSAVGDLNKLADQTKDLIADLGKGASDDVRDALHDLKHDVKDVTQDETAILNDAAGDLKKIQDDVTKLGNQLGSQLTGAAAKHYKALQTVLADVANDIQTGGDATADLAAAAKDEFALLNDVAGHITIGAQATFYDLSFNLTDLATDLASLKV